MTTRKKQADKAKSLLRWLWLHATYYFFSKSALKKITRRHAVSLLLATLPLQITWATSLASVSDHHRWVVLDSILAEIIVALDATEHIVGVVGGTDHLPIPKHVTRFEGYRIVAAEPIMSLNPDRVLIGSDRIMPQTINQLRNAGIQVHQLGAEPHVESLLKRVRLIAELLGKTKEAKTIEKQFVQEMARVQDWLEEALPTKRVRALFVLAGGGRPTVVGGNGTYTGALLTLSGAINVAADVDGYKILSQEAMMMAAPEFILTNEDGLMSGANQDDAVLSAPGVKLTPAARQQQILSLPGRYLQGFGLHTPEAIRLLARHIYPDLQ